MQRLVPRPSRQQQPKQQKPSTAGPTNKKQTTRSNTQLGALRRRRAKCQTAGALPLRVSRLTLFQRHVPGRPGIFSNWVGRGVLDAKAHQTHPKFTSPFFGLVDCLVLKQPGALLSQGIGRRAPRVLVSRHGPRAVRLLHWQIKASTPQKNCTNDAPTDCPSSRPPRPMCVEDDGQSAGKLLLHWQVPGITNEEYLG